MAKIGRTLQTTALNAKVFSTQFALNGVTGTLVNPTDRQATISGSGPGATNGHIVITLGTENFPNTRVFGWTVDLQAATTQVGVYRLEKVAHSAVSGTFTMKLMSGTLPAAGNAPPGLPVYEMSPASGSVASLTGTLTAFYTKQGTEI